MKGKRLSGSNADCKSFIGVDGSFFRKGILANGSHKSVLALPGMKALAVLSEDSLV